MSIVREIVESNAAVTIDSLMSELPKLQVDALALNESAVMYIENVYVKLTKRARPVHYLDQTKKMLDRITEVNASIDEVSKVLPDTKKQIIQFQHQSRLIQENLNLCYSLSHRCEHLQHLQNHIKNGDYLKGAEILQSFKKLDSLAYPQLVKALQKQELLIETNFIVKMNKIVEDHFKLSTLEKDDMVEHYIEILPANESVEQVLKALTYPGWDQFSFLIKIVKFIERVFMDIILYATQINVNDQKCIVSVKVKHNDNYGIVFGNLKEFAAFLTEKLHYDLNGEVKTILYFVGREIEEDLTNGIVNECLKKTIPDTESGLETYKEVQDRCVDLQTTLIKSSIISHDNHTLVDFTLEVKKHFVNKKCRAYQELAMVLMKKDLHVTKIIGEPHDPSNLCFSGFSQCAISQSVMDLMILVTKIIQKEISTGEAAGGKYLETAGVILAQYDAFVSAHHQRLLKTIPQQKAIFHNNCKYIAHELSTPAWNALLQQLPPLLHSTEQFTVLNMHLGDYAVQMLQDMVNEEVGHVRERIHSSGISTADDKLEPAAEKAVRQCLRQQELLKTVWQRVLNYYDYNSTIGVLLDALCRVVVEDIMKISDIPADVCEQLVDILKLIVTRGFKLFTEPKEIHMYVTFWAKLNELMFVLNSSMEAIGDRWADRKGPLALHFTSAELADLIRALFQNTDARAKFLASL